ncbi:hypothetical protein JOC94_004227 [Bacillus thermophilus]|uniref:Uncharacterized protein n=1 Tax=Siminovitchia thermophila TaxID=1245522 RepID=A0ABS2RC15_9BACI|nr:hypothetical protein [Siminovitchia thermophila]MBM7717202.1 hypothetical protein [Siminovitchia thermophila]
MAKTPYKDLSSESILSAHISGLQHDINKLQEVLNLQVATATNHRLRPVIDQDDPALRYRIYEGSVRNWLNNPAPIVYRNGQEIPANEYIIQPAYGVVVFERQQSANDVITADFTHIVSESKTINDINAEISEIRDEIENIGGGGGELPDNYNILGGVAPYFFLPGTYLSHQRRDYHPVIRGEDGTLVYNPFTHYPAFRVLVYANTLDAFPFPLSVQTTFKRAGIMLGSGTNARVRIGLYKDNGHLYPGELIFQSPIITVEPEKWGYAEIDETIPPGLYWIARHDGNNANWNGLEEGSVIQINRFNAETFIRELAERPNPHTTAGGYRATNIPFGNMPSTFPSGIEPFKRTYYCSPWLVTE